MASAQEDSRKRRCPRLGHEVPFRYCRMQEADRLCPQVLNCWWECFAVEDFLRSCYPQEDVDALLHPSSRPKVSTILELIEEAKERRRAAACPPAPVSDNSEA